MVKALHTLDQIYCLTVGRTHGTSWFPTKQGQGQGQVLLVMVRKLGRVRYDSVDSSPPQASLCRVGYQIRYPLVNW